MLTWQNILSPEIIYQFEKDDVSAAQRSQHIHNIFTSLVWTLRLLVSLIVMLTLHVPKRYPTLSYLQVTPSTSYPTYTLPLSPSLSRYLFA